MFGKVLRLEVLIKPGLELHFLALPNHDNCSMQNVRIGVLKQDVLSGLLGSFVEVLGGHGITQ